MSGFQGSISYNSKAGAPAGFINVAGARNGTSIDTGNFVVLGQDVGAAGNPGILLNNREIPMGGFSANWWGGQVIISDAAAASTPGTPLRIVQALTGVQTGPAELLSLSWHTAAATTMGLQIDVDDPAPTINRLMLWARETNTGAGIQMNTQGNMLFTGQLGLFYASITGHTLTTGSIPANAATFEAFDSIEPSTGNGRYRGMAVLGDFTPSGGTTQWIAFNTEAVIDAALGTGNVYGLFINWAVLSVPTGSGKFIGIENVSGDVYLNSVAGANIGRTGIHAMRNPTAWVHIGAGAAAASSAPLKFTTGTLQTTAEAGTIEYNGTNFFATRVAATRETIFTGVSGAAAPATTPTPVFTSFYGGNTIAMGNPNSWASVVIAGTTFKIPLYT